MESLRIWSKVNCRSYPQVLTLNLAACDARRPKRRHSDLRVLVPAAISCRPPSFCLVPGCKNYTKPGLAAHHLFVGLGGTLQREDFSHGPHAGEHAEGERIL